MVIRTPYGGGIRGGLYHSQSGEAYFCHTPGLKVVIPSTPHDAKGLLIASIQDPDPVLFLEPKALYRSVKGEVPEGEYTVDLSTTRTVREGGDVTVFCYGAMVPVAEKAAAQAAEKGIEANIVDLRTLLPLDEEGVLDAAKRTGRVVVVHEAPRFCGFGAELSALIAEHAIEYMEAPIKRVTGFDTPFPNTLEHHYLPDERRILDAIESTYNY
jgi:2-oxoisovalerate dehydrogenase E1 component beta subunit